MSYTPNSIPAVTVEQRRSAIAQYQVANQWIAAGRPERAVAILRGCCRLDPGSLVYRQGLRLARRQLEPGGGLIAQIMKWLAARRLHKALRAVDWLHALPLGEDLLALDPENVEAHLGLAKSFESLGLSSHAVWCLEQAQTADDHKHLIAAELARLCERTGEFSRARTLTNAPAALSPDAEAEASRLQERIAVAPRDVQFYVQLARLYRDAGDRQSARAWFARGMAETANDFLLTVESAQFDIETLQQDALIAEQKLAQHGENSELKAILDRLRHEIQARRIELLRRQVDRNPDDRQASLDLGTMLLKASQFEAALDAFTAARGDDRWHWRAVLYSAYCHLNSRQWRRAGPLFEEALTLLPAEAVESRKEVLFLLAERAAQTGKWEVALGRGMELAGIDPGYRGIGELLKEWRER